MPMPLPNRPMHARHSGALDCHAGRSSEDSGAPDAADGQKNNRALEEKT
jgi:hypothetical protein